MNKDESIRFAARYLEDLLSFFGINVAVASTIDDEVIQALVSTAATVIMAVISWWKNNSFTQAAIEADIVLKQLKDKAKE